jgi:hypothetical protein
MNASPDPRMFERCAAPIKVPRSSSLICMAGYAGARTDRIHALHYFNASDTSLNFWMRFPVSTSAV